MVNFFRRILDYLDPSPPSIRSDEVIERRAYAVLPKVINYRGVPLVWCDKLTDAALSHARVMHARKRLSHDFFGEPHFRPRLVEAGYEGGYAAELILSDVNEDWKAVDSWVDSPAHHRQLVNPKYRRMGCGVVGSGEGGIYWCLILGE